MFVKCGAKQIINMKGLERLHHNIRKQRCGAGVRLLKDGLDSLRSEQWLSDNAAQILCMQDFQEQQWKINEKY